jgi:N4-bis(aminopropyl)spermidine synthase
MDIDAIAKQVAAAVGLAEGDAGVRDVLRIVARAEPVATSQVSRTAELPVPIVTAVCNELRKRGVIDRTRPIRLTAQAREVLAGRYLDPRCPICAGLGMVIPGQLKALADELEPSSSGAPPARMDLDQTHCTVATKIHRVLKLHETGALERERIVLLGDDDLVSVAIARFARLTGTAVGNVTVIDADPSVLGWIGQQLDGTGIDVTLVEHDLRRPLPTSLVAAFDVACTDPPYTVPGARLFLSRAVGALKQRPGQHLFFSFGARRPAEMLETQRLIADLGLVVKALTPNFNSYLGAGVLAGSSHLYELRTTDETAQLVDGDYDGPLYTADTRTVQARPYRCASCGAVHIVGPAAAWAGVADLKAAGCPACGSSTFRPMARQER